MLFEASLIPVFCFVTNSGMVTCGAALQLYWRHQALANASQPLAEVNWQLIFAAGEAYGTEKEKNNLYFADKSSACQEP